MAVPDTSLFSTLPHSLKSLVLSAIDESPTRALNPSKDNIFDDINGVIQSETLQRLLDCTPVVEPIIIERAFSTGLSRGAFRECTALIRRGNFQHAGIGVAAHRTHDSSIRDDRTLWIRTLDSSCPALREYIEIFQSLGEVFNDILRSTDARINLGTPELQLSYYEAGSRGYRRHRDRNSNDIAAKRFISAITYLNPTWKLADGGHLRAFVKSEAVDIMPIAGRLVLFRSEFLEHAVLPVRSPRFAITAWYPEVSCEEESRNTVH